MNNRVALIYDAIAATFAPEPRSITLQFYEYDRNHNQLSYSGTMSPTYVNGRRLDAPDDAATFVCWEQTTTDDGFVAGPVQKVYVVHTVMDFATRITNAKASDVRAWLKGVVSPAAAPLEQRVEILNGNDALYRMCVPPDYHDVTRDVLPPLGPAEPVGWPLVIGALGGAAIGGVVLMSLVSCLLRVWQAKPGALAEPRMPLQAGSAPPSGADRTRRARAYQVGPVGRAAGRHARGSMAAAFAPHEEGANADERELSYSLLRAMQ